MGVKIEINHKKVSSDPQVQLDFDLKQLEICMKKHKKMCDKDDITREWRRHEYYEKPSDRKKREKQRCISNARRAEREANKESF